MLTLIGKLHSVCMLWKNNLWLINFKITYLSELLQKLNEVLCIKMQFLNLHLMIMINV